MEGKIKRSLIKLDEVQQLAALDSVQSCTAVAHKCLSEKGGSQNVKVESIMSHIALWGLILPVYHPIVFGIRTRHIEYPIHTIRSHIAPDFI